jgi:hypothetical protein
LGIQGTGPDGLEDCYQFHGFVLKKNTWKMLQRRFMVLTKKWMFNVDCDFHKKTKKLEFKEMKWRHPIEAITKVIISRTDSRLTLTIFFDPDVQNLCLVMEGHKKIKKFERKLEFRDDTSARDFLFNVVRMQHLWCCSLLSKNPRPRLVVVDKLIDL